MPSRYDDAVTELYQAPLDSFVAERKRLAAGLKAAGDKEGAAKLARLHRPPVSAWAVNQLWWQARRDMEAMLETAERLRAGELGAAPAHREAIAKLRARASAILEKAGHGATDATLRRVTTTLSAIAAAGGFDPDPPGTLTDDRDPPGFETMALSAAAAAAAHHAKGEATEEAEAEQEEGEARGKHGKPAKHEKQKHEKQTAAERRREAAEEKHRRAAEEARERAEEARRRAEEAAEKRRLEQQAARKKAQRERVEAALRTAHGEVERLKRDLDKLRAQVTHAEDRLVRAKEIAADLEGKLAELK